MDVYIIYTLRREYKYVFQQDFTKDKITPSSTVTLQFYRRIKKLTRVVEWVLLIRNESSIRVQQNRGYTLCVRNCVLNLLNKQIDITFSSLTVNDVWAVYGSDILLLS